MPTKFNRDNAPFPVPPYQRQAPGRTWRVSRRTLPVYVVGFLVLLMLAQKPLSKFLTSAPEFSRGTAVVLEKKEAVGEGAPGLLLQITIEGSGAVLKADAELPREYWDRIQPGDKIAVRYVLEGPEARIRILEIGYAPLDE